MFGHSKFRTNKITPMAQQRSSNNFVPAIVPQQSQPIQRRPSAYEGSSSLLAMQIASEPSRLTSISPVLPPSNQPILKPIQMRIPVPEYDEKYEENKKKEKNAEQRAKILVEAGKTELLQAGVQKEKKIIKEQDVNNDHVTKACKILQATFDDKVDFANEEKNQATAADICVRMKQQSVPLIHDRLTKRLEGNLGKITPAQEASIVLRLSILFYSQNAIEEEQWFRALFANWGETKRVYLKPKLANDTGDSKWLGLFGKHLTVAKLNEIIQTATDNALDATLPFEVKGP